MARRDDSIPVLTLNQLNNSTNFYLFKKKLRAFVLTNYSTLEDCIYSSELEPLDEYDLPEDDEIAGLSPENDPGGIKAHVLKKRVEESYKNYLTRTNELKSLFGIIIDHLSLNHSNE